MVLNPSVILYQELHQLVPHPSTQEHRCNCTLMASSHPRRACLRRLAGRCRRGRHGRRLRGVCGCTFLHHGRFPSASFFFSKPMKPQLRRLQQRRGQPHLRQPRGSRPRWHPPHWPETSGMGRKWTAGQASAAALGAPPRWGLSCLLRPMKHVSWPSVRATLVRRPSRANQANCWTTPDKKPPGFYI